MKFAVGEKVRTFTNDSWNNLVGIIEEVNYSWGNPYSVKIKYKGGKVAVNFRESELELVESVDVNEKEKGYFEQKGSEVGKLVQLKQKAYGDSVSKTSKLIRVLLEDYKNEDNTYTIPESLIDHMLLTVRELDKTNRIFSNPEGDLMQENPYQDKVGYGLLGMRMVDEK